MLLLMSTYLWLLVLAVAVNSSSGVDDVVSGKAVFDHYPGIGYLRIMWTTYNWTTAYSFCHDLGAELAVPNSDAEASIYRRMIATLTPSYQELVYIGFHDRFVQGEYETVHDTPLSLSGYTQWANGGPVDDPELRCGGFSKEGGLLNVPCHAGLMTMMSFICEQPSWLGYERFDGVGYYDMRLKGQTWADAWNDCRQDGAHLAVINNMAEHRVLQDIFARHPSIPEAESDIYAWVGVHSDFGYKEFRTVVGTSLADAGYSTWENGYPANEINQSVFAGLKSKNGSLILLPPTKRMAYFCEHEL